jgi:hypothetical protein
VGGPPPQQTPLAVQLRRRARKPRLTSQFVGVALALLLQPSAAQAGGVCPRFIPGSRGLPTVGEWRTHPAIGDVNSDGIPDIAALPRKGHGPVVWIGDGKGSWKLASTGLLLPGFSCGVGVSLADVNGDGHLDLGVADHCNGLFVFLGDGKGIWKLGPPVTRDIGKGYQDMVFTDLNGDGKLDIAAIGAFQGGISAILGDGQGHWKLADMGLPGSGRGSYIKVGDVNEDGRPDVVASFVAEPPFTLPPEKSHNLVWLSQPSGRFAPSTPDIPDDIVWNGVALGDVNGDGHLDLALSSHFEPGRPPLAVYLGDGGKHWKLAGDGLPAADVHTRFDGVELTDLDGDGHLDLVAVSAMDAGIRVWMGDGQGHWTECEDTGLPHGRDALWGWGLAVRDLDGDGRPDIVAGFGMKGMGSVEVWLNRKR